MYESKNIRFSLQASFPKLTILSEVRSCDINLLDSYVPLKLLKSLQALFNPFSDSALSKVGVKIWGEEPDVGELHAAPTKFRYNLPSFHYLKKAIAQNYEGEINLNQRAYILT